MEPSINFYKNFNEENFIFDLSCFLCGKECDSKTAEHIFPKWLQHKFNLWDKKLTITNRTAIPYRNLTVPCCSECNNVHLSKMEEKFKLLLNKSFQELTFEDEKTIFQWTAKILYATRYKELSLLVDRANPTLGNVISPRELESYSSLHLFLQSIRFKTEFNEPRPWSIFIFSCNDEEFWYHNSIPALCLTMKFGEIAITIIYKENNLISTTMAPLKDLNKTKLNFPQYLETTAHIFYSGMLKEKVPHYISSFNENTRILIINTVGALKLRKWVDKEFAAVLDYMLFSCGINIGRSVFQPDGLLTSFLVDANNEHLLKEHFRNKKVVNKT